MENENVPIGFPPDQQDVPTNAPLPNLKDAWRLLVLFGSLGGVVIAIALGFQLNTYDIYWEQSLPGFFILLMNYGWLIVAGFLHLVAGVSLMAWKKQTGLTSVLSLAAWAIITFNVIIQAYAYKTAAISSFPTMQLWWTTLGVEMLIWLGVLIGSANRQRIIIGVLGVICAAGVVLSINVAHRNIAIREAKAAESNVVALQAVIDSNNPSRCTTFATNQPNPLVVNDACITGMIVKFHRTDICFLLQPSTQEDQIQKGNCPKVAPVDPNQVILTTMDARMINGRLEINWSTNIAADAEVVWGPTSDYGQSRKITEYKKINAVLVDVKPDEQVRYRITVCTVPPTKNCYRSPSEGFYWVPR